MSRVRPEGRKAASAAGGGKKREGTFLAAIKKNHLSSRQNSAFARGGGKAGQVEGRDASTIQDGYIRREDSVQARGDASASDTHREAWSESAPNVACEKTASLKHPSPASNKTPDGARNEKYGVL